MPGEFPAKRSFQVEVTDRSQVTTSIQYRNSKGVISDKKNKIYRIMKQRSVPYGKGAGGGGGKYIMGQKQLSPGKLSLQPITNLNINSARLEDPNDYTPPPFNYETNGYQVDTVTAPHQSIFASRMIAKREKFKKVLDVQCLKNQAKLRQGFEMANPAKKFKETLMNRRATKDMLFSGFDFFKNWDTRIVGSEEEALEIQNGY